MGSACADPGRAGPGRALARWPLALMRLGGPHRGHVALIERVLTLGDGRGLILVGSAEVEGRADVPWSYAVRRRWITELMARCGVDGSGLRWAGLAERATQGWDAEWCGYLLARCRGLGVWPRWYVFGDDYQEDEFSVLVEQVKDLELVSLPRVGGWSGRGLRAAWRGASATEGYAMELSGLRAASSGRPSQRR